MSRVDLLLEKLAASHQMDAPEPDAEGSYHLTVDSEITVRCFEKFDLVHLVSPLPALPSGEDNADRLLRRLLQRVMMHAKRSKAAVTMDEQGHLYLVDRFPASLAETEFEDRLAVFINTVESHDMLLSERVAGGSPLGGPATVLRP